MSEEKESSQKTEQPTAVTLRNARQKGQVPNSKLVPTALSVLFVIIWLRYDWNNINETIKSMFDMYAYPLSDNVMEQLYAILGNLLADLIVVLAPLLICMIVGAVVGNIAVKGLVFSLDPVTPNLKRLDPIQGTKKLFKLEHFYQFTSAIIISVALMVTGYGVIIYVLPSLLVTLTCGIDCISGVGFYAFQFLAGVMASIFLVACLIDWKIQHQIYIRSNKMTKEQVKRENKQQDGDPAIKSKRKQIAREMVEGGDASAGHGSNSDAGGIRVANRQPTVVISDGGYLAIGIRYVMDENQLPYIVAKGYLMEAKALLDAASLSNTYVHHDPSSAQRLYDNFNIGDQITKDHFSLVVDAVVIATQRQHHDK